VNTVKMRFGVLLALSVIVMTIPQSAFAENTPEDTAYSANLSSKYTDVYYVVDNAYVVIATSPDANLKSTSAKYKAWIKKMIPAIDKVLASIPAVVAITPSPGYAKSDALLKKYLKDVTTELTLKKKTLLAKKIVNSDLTKDASLISLITKDMNAWSSAQQADSALANFSAPSTWPTITFSQGPDQNNILTLYATLADSASFSQKALQVTGYAFEWYEGTISATPIPTKILLADLTDEQKKAPLTVSLSGVVSKGTYLFRVAAINSAGQGEWSTPFTTTMP
jgi:hypothetical protein